MVKNYAFLFFIFLLLISCTPVVNEQQIKIAPICLQHQSQCEVSVDVGTFLVKFDVEKVLTEVPFKIVVEFIPSTINLPVISNVDGLSKSRNTEVLISQLTGFIEGKEMYMGKIPLNFSLSKTANIFIANSLLGSCSDEHMVWRLWLIVSVVEPSSGMTSQRKFFIDFNSDRF